MSALANLVRRYSRTRSVTARRQAVRLIRELGTLESIATDDEAFAILVGAPTIAAGASPEESPVLLALPAITRERDFLALAFQRYHFWDELVALRESPHLPAGFDGQLLDQGLFGERPSVAFSRWLDVPTVDWEEMDAAVRDAPGHRRLIGPESRLEPLWLAILDRYLSGFRPDLRAQGLLRSAGFAANWALARILKHGLLPAVCSLTAEVDALMTHPDPFVTRTLNAILAE